MSQLPRIANACIARGFWAVGGIDGGQGEAVRVPFADGTLVRVPGSGHSEQTMRSFSFDKIGVAASGRYSRLCGSQDRFIRSGTASRAQRPLLGLQAFLHHGDRPMQAMRVNLLG